MWFAGALPAVVNAPPAINSPLGRTLRDVTVLSIPEPNGDHEEPFQRAMLFTPTPPAVPKYPPATNSPAGRTARHRTAPLIPDANGDHVAPFHRAM
jgi:hypothetical protein